MFANLGFGGLAIWGKSFVEDDDMAKALVWSDFLVTGPAVVVESRGGYAPALGFVKQRNPEALCQTNVLRIIT